MNQAPNEKARPQDGTGQRADKREHRHHTTAPATVKPHFDPDTLEAMRGRLPEYLAARGVELRPQGARLACRCPRHEDKSPSFAVFAGGRRCGCYPCGFSGDCFDTAIWLGRASTFPEAVADVAAGLGVILPQGTAPSPPRAPQAPPRAAPRPEPEPAGLTDAEREQLHAARLAFSDAFDAGELDTLAGGLGIPLWAFRWAAKGQSGLDWVDGRLAYLYQSGLKVRGRPGESPRFRWIFGRAALPWRWEWASKPEVRTVYVTEGESDAIALVAAGIETDGRAAVVASPGTSFKREWGPLFRGKRVVICFDLDPAGRAAASAVAEIVRPFASEVSTWKGPKL